MGSTKNGSVLGDGSFLMGAIFMSNHATKKECFSRKLFGSPSCQADFVKKLKMGMILFLFEYEERKLYGVFEATSDGAMDIIPTAFISSGKTFSAQVRFRTIWRCQPLMEAEFYDAIKENYYTRSRFHVHLSDTQVYKLVNLFYSKRCCSRGRKFIPGSIHPRKNGDKKYQSFKSGKYEPHLESNTELNIYPNLLGTGLDQFMYHHKRSVQTTGSATGGIEDALHPTVLEQPELPDIVDSNSQGARVFRGNVSVNPEGSLDMGLSPIAQTAPYPEYESSCSLTALASRDIRKRGSITNLRNSITTKFQNRVVITNLQSSNVPSFQGFNDHHHSDISLSNHGNYTKMHADVTTSMRRPTETALLGYGHRAATSHSDDNSRGPRYFQLGPHEINCGSEYEANNLKITDSSFCSSPEKPLSQMLYGSDPPEYQDEGSSSYHLYQDDEYYPVDGSSKFHSESREKRTSVFLRLSGLQKASAEKVETYCPHSDISLDELVRCLTGRRKYWSKMSEVQNLKETTKVSDFRETKSVPTLKNVNKVFDQSALMNDDEQLENVDQMETQATVFCNREQPYGGEGTNDGSAFPFLNFKRRSGTQRIACETETSNSVVLKENEVSLVKDKRRKLLRPSFGEEDASHKVDDVQNVLEKIVKPFLKGNDGECNESAFIELEIGSGTHAAAKSSCSPTGPSKEHAIEKVQVTVGEHVEKAGSFLASETDAAKPMELNSEVTTILTEDECKFQKMQESFLNHGDPVLVVDGCVSGYNECKAGGKEVEVVDLSLELRNEDAITDICGMFQNVQSPSECFHVGSLFVKTDDSKGDAEHCDASHGNTRGERRHEAEYPGENTSRGCNLELSLGHWEIGTGELSPNQCLNHEKAARKSQEEDVSKGVHSAEFHCKNSNDSQRNPFSMVNTQEDPTTRVWFREFDSEKSNVSKRKLPRTAVGGQLSSSTFIHYSTGAFRDAEEENIGSEKNPGLDSNYKKGSHGYLPSSFECVETLGLLSQRCIIHTEETAAGTIELCGKGPLDGVADNEIKTSHQCQLCAAEDAGTQGSLSRPCIVQAGKSTANPKDYLTSGTHLYQTGALFPEIIDTGRKTYSCNLVRPTEFIFTGEILSSSEAAESTQPYKNEDRVPANLDGSYAKTSHRGPGDMGSLLDLSLAVGSGMPCLPTDLGHDDLPLSLGRSTVGGGA